jgi:8-oxo-dGTP pyrophosphatase MutT (NUDIX family)
MASTVHVPDSLKQLAVPSSTLLASLPAGYDGIASGILAFHPTAIPAQLLLVQRAAHDTMPNRWEVPGGAVDDTDATFLEGAARELREEAGLTVTKWVRPVGLGEDGDDELSRTAGYTWLSSRGLRIIGFTVEAEVQDGEVKLDPNEHQDWTWATREEVESGECQGRKLEFTSPGRLKTILQGFKLRAERISAAAQHEAK